MTTPDFEIYAGLRARRLVSRIPPDVEVTAEGESVTLYREQRRSGVPEDPKEGDQCVDVAVDKRVIGRIDGRPC